MKRTQLREHIFKLAFGIEFNREEEMPEQFELYSGRLEDASEEEQKYIKEKAENIAGRAREIDALINERATKWKTTRMNKVDLTILRLAVYEIKWDEDVPTKVAIDEAVELAKKYSSGEGPSFVNGVLAKLAD